MFGTKTYSSGPVLRHLPDDTVLSFGNTITAPNIKIEWDTIDANANHLKFDLPAGGAVDVPVVSFGVGIKDVDLATFNGLTNPQVAVWKADRTAHMRFGYETGSTTLNQTGMAIKVPDTQKLIFETGTDQVVFCPAQTGFDLRAIFRATKAAGQCGFELGEPNASLFFMRYDGTFDQAGYYGSSFSGLVFLFSHTNNRDVNHDVAVLDNPAIMIHSTLSPNTDHSEKMTLNYRGIFFGDVNTTDPITSSHAMETDRAAYDTYWQGYRARQNASAQTNKTGGSVYIIAGDGNILDTVSGIGGNIILTPGSQDDDNNGEPGRVQIDLPQSTAQPHVGGTLKVDTTDVGNVGAGEDDLITYSLPAFTLQKTGDFVEVIAYGTFAANANNKTVKLKFGATNLYVMGPYAANAGSWKIHAYIIRTGAATQETIADGMSSNTLVPDDTDFVTPAETLANAITVKCTGEATNNDDIVQEGLIVIYHPAK